MSEIRFAISYINKSKNAASVTACTADRPAEACGTFESDRFSDMLYNSAFFRKAYPYAKYI